MTFRVEVKAQRAAAWLAVACFACPVAVLVARAVSSFDIDLLMHLGRTVLPMQLLSSLSIGLGAVLVGSALALGGYACSVFEFAGRLALERLMLVPLLLPGWFLAVIHHECLGLQGRAGLTLVFGVVAAPLFVLFVNAELNRLPRRYPELLRVLDRSAPLRSIRVLWPLAVPAWAAAGALVFLLTVADDAGARTMAVPTLTVGLFDQWFGRGDDAAGALLSLVLLAVCLVPLVALWRLFSRRGDRSDSAGVSLTSASRQRLRGWRAAVPWLLAVPELALGVIVPAVAVGGWGVERLERVNLDVIGLDSMRTLLLAVAGTALAVLLALPVLHVRATSRWSVAAAASEWLGAAVFAMPALILGMVFLWLGRAGGARGLASSWNATSLPLIIAIGLRYAAVFVLAGEATLARRAWAHAETLRALGRSGLLSLARCLFPFFKSSFAAAGAFVFLEMLKDIQLTLILQPFGFGTINTRMFQYAGTGRIRECAVLVVCLVLLGLYPLSVLARAVGGQDDRQGGR